MTALFSDANGDAVNRASPLTASQRSLAFTVSIFVIIVGAAILKSTLLFRAVGFEQGDPLEYINIAHAIAYRTGEEWWEIRPLLYPLILVPVTWVGGLLPDPTGEAAVRLLRSTPLAFSLGCLAVSAAIAGTLSGRFAAVCTALMLASSSIFNQLSVAPFAEIPATFGILLATLIAIRAQPTTRSGLAVGVALGLGCMARYQSLAFIVPFGLWMLLSGSRARLTGFMGGLLACGALQGLLDILAYGAPFHSLIQSAAYNVTTDEAATFYGAEPPWWYAKTIGDWLGYASIALALLGSVMAVRGNRRREWSLVLALAALMLIWLSAIAHKELRFTSQIAPFLIIAAGHGTSSILRSRSRFGPYVATMAIALATFPGYWQSISLDLTFNPGFVEGPKLVAAQRPGAVLGTIPWFVARPYTHNRIELVRADVDLWDDPQQMSSVIEQADYLLLREYDFAADRAIDRMINSQFRTIETYPEQVVLLEKRQSSDTSRAIKAGTKIVRP